MNDEMIPVRSEAVEWLKKHYPALCEKSGLCERIAGKLYTRTALDAQPAASAEPVGYVSAKLLKDFRDKSAEPDVDLHIENIPMANRIPGKSDAVPIYTNALAAHKPDGGDANARIALKVIAEYPTPGDGSMSAANMREIARKALMAAPLPPSPPSISYRKIESGGGGTDAAVAAIRFALEADDGMAWLRCWNEGDFDACRNEWPETPEECFIGADPLHPSTRAILAAQSSDGVEDALRQRLGEALTDAMAQNVDTDTKTFCIDPFNSDNIDPLLDAILKVLTGK